jgi:VCBS repeat-containing protein
MNKDRQKWFIYGYVLLALFTVLVFTGCDGVATLFHGEKPGEENPGAENNANLSNITASNGRITPAFSADVTEYRLIVPAQIKTTLTLTATSESSAANVTYNPSPTIDLSASWVDDDGKTHIYSKTEDGKSETVTITVTAADGTKKTYTVIISGGPAPELTESGTANIITWNPITVDDQATCASVYRGEKQTDGTYEWKTIGDIWTELEVIPIPGQITFYDYFAVSGVNYIYQVFEAHYNYASNDLVSYYSECTDEIQGKASNDTTRADANSTVSYNQEIGSLSFAPPLPAPSPHVSGITPIVVLVFGNESDNASLQIFKNPLPLYDVNLTTLQFIKYFNSAVPLSVDYVAAYEQLNSTSNLHIVVYPSYTKNLTGIIEGIEIPSGISVNLEAPDGNITAPTTSSLTLNWDLVTGATGYEISWSTSRDGPYTIVYTADQFYTSWVHIGLESDREYFYKIQAYNSSVKSNFSRIISAKTTPAVGEAIPDAPVKLRVPLVTQDSITIAWDAVSEAAGYRVYRNITLINTVSSSTTTYTDNGLLSNTFYTYEVSAYNSNDVEGPKSSSITRKTDAAGQSGTLDAPVITATAMADGRIKVQWSPVPEATGYDYYYGYNQSGPFYNDWWPVEVGDFYFIDGDVSPGETWYYRVKARNDSTTSDWSNTASATALTPTTPATGERVSVAVTVGSLSDVTPLTSQTVSKSSASSVSLWADSGHASYAWYVNGALQSSTSNPYSFDVSSGATGVYEVTVVVTKNNGERLSGGCRIRVTN